MPNPTVVVGDTPGHLTVSDLDFDASNLENNPLLKQCSRLGKEGDPKHYLTGAICEATESILLTRLSEFCRPVQDRCAKDTL